MTEFCLEIISLTFESFDTEIIQIIRNISIESSNYPHNLVNLLRSYFTKVGNTVIFRLYQSNLDQFQENFPRKIRCKMEETRKRGYFHNGIRISKSLDADLAVQDQLYHIR